MIRRDEPVFHPVGLSDKGRVGSFTVNMAVIALPDAVTGERFHDLRAGIVLVQRRVVEEHDLFPIPGGEEGRLQPHDLPAQDLGVVFCAGLLFIKPSSGAA